MDVKDTSYQALNLVIQIRLLGDAPNTPRKKQRKEAQDSVRKEVEYEKEKRTDTLPTDRGRSGIPVQPCGKVGTF